MEPLDPARNDEGSGFSKRRISSILKAPRKSIRFPDPEQQENVVECVKPVEKRISRRVSFAPADDVLVFTKDVKNARSPLQDLMTTTAAAATQNRVQVAVTDGIQQITGMETLLNAPLHASQQRDKVTFDTGADFGERTVMFSTDDAFMDMTHSHTINIANDAELLADISFRNYDALPTRGEKTVMFTANDGCLDKIPSGGSVSLPTSRNMDLSVEKINISSSVPSFNPGFENFLASLSKPSGPSVNPVITRMTPPAGVSSEETSCSLAQNKTQRAVVDKENQAPTSVSAVMEKSLNTSRKIGELSYGSALCPKDDISMDMTEAHTGRILGLTDDDDDDDDDDDVFQCLIPTQKMRSHLDNRVPQTAEKTKQQQSGKTPASFNPQDMTSLKNPPLHASLQKHKVNFDAKDECREKTIMFTAGDEFMDMTQCHTVNISSGSVAPPNQNVDIFPTREKRDKASSATMLQERKRETCGAPGSSAHVDPEFQNFLSALFKPSASSGNPPPLPASSSQEAVNTNSSLSQVNSDGEEKRAQNKSRSFGGSLNVGTVCPENDVSMDMTKAQTGRITALAGSDDPFQFLFPTQDMYSQGDSQKKQEKTSGQKNCTGLETSSKPLLKTNMQRNQAKFDAVDDCRDKTVRFTADDACMDVTQSHTVNIATHLKLQSQQNSELLPTCGEKTVRFTANDAAMDMTQCLTVNIANSSVSDSVRPVKNQEVETSGLPRNRPSSAHSLDPRFNTSLSKPSGPGVNPVIAGVKPTAVQSFNIRDSLNGGTVCPEEDVTMEMTEAQTGRILAITGADDPLQCLFPTKDMYPQSSSLKKEEMTSQQQHNEALGSSNRKGMETTLTTSSKTRLQRQVKCDIEDDYREKTVRFTADDAAMDVTRSHTVNIATDLHLQSHQNVDFLPAFGEKTVRFTANDAAMDVTRSHTAIITTDLQLQSQQNVDFLPAFGEKTVRFTANDAAMDVTRSHTAIIATDLQLQSQPHVDFLPACGEKTVRFSASDAAMDVTRSHTAIISTDFDPKSHQNVDFLPAFGEKTVRFTANDAAMDVTRSHTAIIATDLHLPSHQTVDSVPASGEKTVRFTATDAAMDVTRSHTAIIATGFDPQSHQNVGYLPASGEKTVRFTATDAAMDVTQCLTVNIATDSVSDSPLPHQDSHISSTHENMDVPLSPKRTRRPRRTRSSSANALDLGFKNSQSRTSGPLANPVIAAVAPAAPSPQETLHTNGFLDQLTIQRPGVGTEKEAPDLVSAVLEKPVNKTMTDGPEEDVSMDMTEAQTGRILEETYTDGPLQGFSSTQDLHTNSDHLTKTGANSQQRNALGSSNSDGVEITNLPDSLDSDETDTRDPEPRNQTLSQKMESPPSAVDDVDAAPSRKSRRVSLADLQSKLRRLSHMINTAPDAVPVDGCTASLPQLEHNMDKTSNDKTKSLPVTEPEPEVGLVNTQENTQAQGLMQEEQPSSTASPFKLKTKKLMSRLSVGGFKAKLPRRSRSDDSKKVNSVGEHTRTVTVNVTNHLSNFDHDVSDIYDEELGSYEDMSETLDIMSPQKATEEVSASKEFNKEELLEDNVFEQGFNSAVNGKKRSLPEDENTTEDEKRMKKSTDMVADGETGLPSDVVECEGNITTAPSMTTQTTEYSNNSHTASIRCEATFESTFKQSLFESQLEDYTNDVYRKLDDGTITVLEFFKLFNIDFVIHNPRQSVLPGRLLSDTDRTPMDLLKDRHISWPKQMVYEKNVLSLTEKVEGLKERMRDLDKPLKTVNRALWEEVRNSSEMELKSFGAKLKERNNLFRKMSKVQSHEMKEVLYADLVQANLEEQQRLGGTIEEADEMIKSLDDCIRDVETELAAVEEKGTEDTPGLKSLQEEMQKVTEALADNDRQISELEIQKKQNANKLNRLIAETRSLESHISMLNLVNEWKFGEKTDNCAVYTFLHETLHLQLVYEKPNGNDADGQSERKISDIRFKRQLDDEKSWGHACLVHKLLTQYIEGETDWVEKYPTSRHVPKLMHDVGLVVGRCRLLGEELRRLEMWGSLPLDILNISCVDTQVHIVFSSLKALSKFEVIFSVTLMNHFYVLQVQSFKNVIGNTTIQQIEDIVASFSPGKNLLTKIVKKIHEKLLC